MTLLITTVAFALGHIFGYARGVRHMSKYFAGEAKKAVMGK